MCGRTWASPGDNAKRAVEKQMKLNIHYRISPIKQEDTLPFKKEVRDGNGNDEKWGGSKGHAKRALEKHLNKRWRNVISPKR